VRRLSGGWECPPGETAASIHGLSYRVRTDVELHPLFIQNLKFLQDFWIHEYPVASKLEEQIQACISTSPGISIAQLLDAFSDLPVDVVWALLTHHRVFTNLEASSLMQWDQVMLYLSVEEVERDVRQIGTLAPPLPLFLHICFDGRLWEVEKQGETVLMRPEVGSVLTLPAHILQHLLTAGQAVEAGDATPSVLTQEAREILSHAGPTQLQTANQRLSTILAYVNGEGISVTARSVQNWLKGFRQAESTYGCGYLGLLDKSAQRGNREARVESASKELLTAFLKTHYAVPQAKRAFAVYALYREECTKRKISPVSPATFYRERKLFTTPEVTAARRGRRAAYQERPWFFSLDQTTPRHGERPFAIAHLDHTPLDIVLVSSITSKPLARPWLSFMTDAYSRRILAAHVSYEEPSYRSAMMIFRLCVQRYGRLPQELVVDHGPDFESVYFEALLAQCFMTKIERPAGEPRAGAVIERLFGKTEADFIQQLRGNTQASKIPRQMTRTVDPKRLAVWTIERLTVQLRDYVHEYYDQMEHSALFMSPREAYTQGMQLAGVRSHRIIPYSDAFLMQTRPTTRTGVAKIHASRGITINGLQYWNERMHATDIAGRSVPVRFEPYDMGIVFAFIDGQWLECVAVNYAQVDIPEMLRYWQWFGEWSVGCVGILSDWVVETVSSLCRAGKTTLTIDDLKKHALKPDQRFRLETEARTGEFKVEQAKAKSEQDLQELLGKPQAFPGSSTTYPRDTSGMPPQPSTPLPRSGKRIGRAAHRDPVGTGEAPAIPGISGKCSFFGPIGVTDQQYQESSVWHVECQTCGARRSMKEIRDRQKFPSHPARKTLPPKGELRWVLQGSTWTLAEN
jgi:putative transposase